MNDESAPRGAHEVPTKGPLNMITVPTDICRDQLTRIETILNHILRSLAPLAGAR